ncbi:glycosyltransferase [Halobacteriovorax sp. HLS]|uniref:glycosyltransferase n=1 Tax=Halobacteriovorax sp. HLS TaxID=2234000 RepID=UPI000FD6ED72|nr:glycosyltransferase [Halobacteriovorax sp. HLS]
MKLLFLTPQLPFPSNSGGKIKTFKMIEHFGNQYDLSLGVLIKKDQVSLIPEFMSRVKVSQTFSEVVDKPRTIVNFLKSLFARKPLSVFRNYSSSFKVELSKNIYNYDTVVVDHFLMFQYIPQDYKGKIIFHAHNAEFLMWSRYSKLSTNVIKKFLLFFESKRIRQYERKICKKSNVVLASPNDILELKKLAPSTEFRETFHLGDDGLLRFYHPGFDSCQEQISYVGSLDWQPNEDGLRWFISNVWNEFHFKFPKATLSIIGKGASEDFAEFCNKYENVELHGFVENLENELSKTKVLIAPLRFGSGMKVKTINSLYTGIPLVTTSVGSEGIEIVDQMHYCKADTARDQLHSLTQLFTDKDFWEHIGGEARELAKVKYTWKNNLNNITEVINGSSEVRKYRIQSTEEKFAA